MGRGKEKAPIKVWFPPIVGWVVQLSFCKMLRSRSFEELGKYGESSKAVANWIECGVGEEIELVRA